MKKFKIISVSILVLFSVLAQASERSLLTTLNQISELEKQNQYRTLSIWRQARPQMRPEKPELIKWLRRSKQS